MDYSNKILVAAGCSHTYGQFKGDSNRETCHERSWPNKLARALGFKDCINLSDIGGSNKRSIRVLTDYVLHNNKENLVVFLGLTELSRTELYFNNSLRQQNIQACLNLKGVRSKFEKNIGKIGSWSSDTGTDLITKNYLRTYYFEFFNEEFESYLLELELHKLHAFLGFYNIEHYFPVIFGDIVNYKSFIDSANLPFVWFNEKPAINYVTDAGFKNGTDLNIICNHFDHDAHECMANIIANDLRK